MSIYRMPEEDFCAVFRQKELQMIYGPKIQCI